MVNLDKMKVMIFNTLVRALAAYYFFMRKEIEITRSYTWGFSSQDHASIYNRLSNLGSTKAMDLLLFLSVDAFIIL